MTETKTVLRYVSCGITPKNNKLFREVHDRLLNVKKTMSEAEFDEIRSERIPENEAKYFS